MSDAVSYRLVHEADLPALAKVQSEAVRWLADRQGRDASRISLSDEPSPQAQHLLRTDPDLWWLAELDGRALGFSGGWVRGELWVLSNLFVHPDAHSRGIGQELLRCCYAASRARGPTTSAIVSSGHASAQSLYIRLGLVPRFPLFVLQGPAEALRTLPAPVIKPKHPSDRGDWQARLSDLDETIWGRRREIDHRFWLGESYLTCQALQQPDGQLLAYVYFSPDYIGPLAARAPSLQLQLLRLAGEAQVEAGSTEVRLHVPGVNGTVLRALLERGFQIDHANLVMMSRSFGRFDRYVPSGGMML